VISRFNRKLPLAATLSQLGVHCGPTLAAPPGDQIFGMYLDDNSAVLQFAKLQSIIVFVQVFHTYMPFLCTIANLFF